MAMVAMMAITVVFQREGRDYHVVQRELDRLAIGPGDLVATTGQAWLALRPRLGDAQLDEFLDLEGALGKRVGGMDPKVDEIGVRHAV